MTPVGANHLLSKLTSQAEVVNLSGNNIGKIGCDHLCSIISLKNSRYYRVKIDWLIKYNRLIEINLEANKLGDNAVGQICEAIAYNDSVKILNIGKNLLSDNVAEKIGKMLELNTTLEQL